MQLAVFLPSPSSPPSSSSVFSCCPAALFPSSPPSSSPPSPRLRHLHSLTPRLNRQWALKSLSPAPRSVRVEDSRLAKMLRVVTFAAARSEERMPQRLRWRHHCQGLALGVRWGFGRFDVSIGWLHAGHQARHEPRPCDGAAYLHRHADPWPSTLALLGAGELSASGRFGKLAGAVAAAEL